MIEKEMRELIKTITFEQKNEKGYYIYRDQMNKIIDHLADSYIKKQIIVPT